MSFFSENLQVFKKVFLPLFVLVVLSGNIEMYLNMQIEGILRSPEGSPQFAYVLGFISILNAILFPVLTLAIALYAFNQLRSSPETLGRFLKRHLNQLYIETLRYWGKSLTWSLLFILPGLWKYVEYSMVPFV
ncbi:MAG: hypothetical protein AAGB31_03895, partial [Bdellovibrio sp.]